jgi:hypothetical protein
MYPTAGFGIFKNARARSLISLSDVRPMAWLRSRNGRPGQLVAEQRHLTSDSSRSRVSAF